MLLSDILLAVAVAVGVTELITRLLLPVLRRKKAGQMIREDGPTWHKTKEGTPTLGGVFFIAGTLAACLTLLLTGALSGKPAAAAVLLYSVVCACVGFVDDYSKLIKKRNLGLRAGPKFLLQLVVAVAFVLIMMKLGILTTNLYIPFIGKHIGLNEFVFVPFAAFVAVACLNGVNITDGVDGLATGVTIPVAIALMFIASALKNTVVFCISLALTGSLLCFLLYNFHPAKVFMGDTGSLFLGGIVCALVFALDMPLLLVPLGMVYLVETLSDIIQISYFKATHGKRIFKMAPIHHHFEMCGWSEIKVFTVFTAVSAVFAVISYFAAI